MVERNIVCTSMSSFEFVIKFLNYLLYFFLFLKEILHSKIVYFTKKNLDIFENVKLIVRNFKEAIIQINLHEQKVNGDCS